MKEVKAIPFTTIHHYIMWNKDLLSELKEKITKKEIDEYLTFFKYLDEIPNYTVTDKSEELCLSYSKNDYVSLAAYYWPNPNTKDGLPYINYDGKSTPENDFYDKNKLKSTAFVVYQHLLEYFISDNKIYYEKAKERLKVFFIDSKTKMNPNMNHAQLIKGVNDGRGIGIIDFANFTYALNLFYSLYKMSYIEEDFYQDIKFWCMEFLKWIKYSPIALEEKDGQNNHGIYYDLLCLVLERIAENNDEIRVLCYGFISNRIERQLKEDGSMPLELLRTKSKSYSIMAFKGICDFIDLACLEGYDIYNLEKWYYRKIDLHLLEGYLFLYDRLMTKKIKWEGKQIVEFDEANSLSILINLVRNYGEKYNVISNYDDYSVKDKGLLIISKVLLK